MRLAKLLIIDASFELECHLIIVHLRSICFKQTEEEDKKDVLGEKKEERKKKKERPVYSESPRVMMIMIVKRRLG